MEDTYDPPNLTRYGTVEDLTEGSADTGSGDTFGGGVLGSVAS